MTDFTPTTEQVCDAYVRAMRNAFVASADEHGQEFDRWLETQLHPLAAIRAAHAEYEHTGDLHELARAIRNILNGPDGDWLPDNQQTPLPRP